MKVEHIFCNYCGLEITLGDGKASHSFRHNAGGAGVVDGAVVQSLVPPGDLDFHQDCLERMAIRAAHPAGADPGPIPGRS